MPTTQLRNEINTEEVQEIIGSVPSWIIRWGITVVILIIALFVVFSAFIQYPEIVRAPLKINSSNAPKSVLAKQNGKLSAILVREGQTVSKHQRLAFFESTANVNDILSVSTLLHRIRSSMVTSDSFQVDKIPSDLRLGEIQGNYQSFFQDYIAYVSTLKNGYYKKQIKYLLSEAENAKKVGRQIQKQREIQVREYANIELDYAAYKQLHQKKVISSSEFRQKENMYFSAAAPIQQSDAAILNNNSLVRSRQREAEVLSNQALEQKAKFLQALSQFLAVCDRWLSEYTLSSPIDGKVTFAGIIQLNQNVSANQEVFVISPEKTDYFGVVQIPQFNMGKIHKGQTVMIKMHSFPYEQYGIVQGELEYISDAAFKDSVFIAKVKINGSDNLEKRSRMLYKNGMSGDAEIITQKSSILERLLRNLIKIKNTYQ